VWAALLLVALVVWIGSGWLSVELYCRRETVGLGYGRARWEHIIDDPSYAGMTWSNAVTFYSNRHPWSISGWPLFEWHNIPFSGRAGPGTNRYELALWPVVGLLAVPAIISWRSHLRTAKRRSINHCVDCGYDLAGLGTDAKCPECGRVS
jgi:hypothetical protein